MMVDIRLRMTDEMWNAILQTAYDASTVYNQEIPTDAVILASITKGIGAVRYEMTQDTPKLRLVTNNDRTRDSRRDMEAVSQSNTSERSEG